MGHDRLRRVKAGEAGALALTQCIAHVRSAARHRGLNCMNQSALCDQGANQMESRRYLLVAARICSVVLLASALAKLLGPPVLATQLEASWLLSGAPSVLVPLAVGVAVGLEVMAGVLGAILPQHPVGQCVGALVFSSIVLVRTLVLTGSPECGCFGVVDVPHAALAVAPFIGVTVYGVLLVQGLRASGLFARGRGRGWVAVTALCGLAAGMAYTLGSLRGDPEDGMRAILLARQAPSMVIVVGSESCEQCAKRLADLKMGRHHAVLVVPYLSGGASKPDTDSMISIPERLWWSFRRHAGTGIAWSWDAPRQALTKFAP